MGREPTKAPQAAAEVAVQSGVAHAEVMGRSRHAIDESLRVLRQLRATETAAMAVLRHSSRTILSSRRLLMLMQW